MASATSPGQRRKAGRHGSGPSVVRIKVPDRLGHSRWVTGDLLDSAEDGIGIAVFTPLPVGSSVTIKGKFGVEQSDSQRDVTIRWCTERPDGTFRAGLEFLDQPNFERPGAHTSQPVDFPQDLDCYEVLQLSPNADPEMIHRVYRLLAARHHPDNAQSGNSEAFVKILAAYQILIDPEKRAGYDARHRETHRLQWQIFDQNAVAAGPEAEKPKRQGILGLLYAKALQDPEDAWIGIRNLEELLSCPREHLKSALWYLKGKGWIQRSDNGRYCITVEGFEQAEASPARPKRVLAELAPAEPPVGS